MRDEPVDEPALYRNQPGLRSDENAECHLDGSGAPVIFLIDRIDEQRPAVLQVGDHHHADDAGDKLAPPRAFGSQYLRFECVSPCGHFFLPGRSSNPDARVSLRYYWRRQARRTRSSTYVFVICQLCSAGGCSATPMGTRDRRPGCPTVSTSRLADRAHAHGALERDDFIFERLPALPLCLSISFFAKPVPALQNMLQRVWCTAILRARGFTSLNRRPQPMSADHAAAPEAYP